MTYSKALEGSPLIPVAIHENAEPVWHLFVVRVSEREEFQKRLADDGIATGIHYPLPLHLQPAYAHMNLPVGSFPVTERIVKEIVSLPVFPELTSSDLEAVTQTIHRLAYQSA